MTAENQDFIMNIGEAKKIDVSETIDDDTGMQVDSTGFNELTWVLKRSRNTDPLVTKTESGSVDVTMNDPSVTSYTIWIQPEDTEGIVGATKQEEEFYHRVRLKDGSDHPSDLLEGTITVRQA